MKTGTEVSLRQATFEQNKAIVKLASCSPFTKHFSYIAYCNRQRYAIGDIWIVMRNEELAAFSCTRIKRRKQEAELDIIATAPEHRGHGAATALIRNLIYRAGALPTVLGVHKVNESAIRLYTKLGFTIIGDALNGEAYKMQRETGEGLLSCCQ
jgi:ribosomal protein S18 acetylase RimI-like enzyme